MYHVLLRRLSAVSGDVAVRMSWLTEVVAPPVFIVQRTVIINNIHVGIEKSDLNLLS
jgi:hypothetical protein